MALMTCPDCANQYPDDAPYCPNCGRPNPARQAGATGASSGGTQPETPASTGPTSSTYTAGTGPTTGPTGQAGPSGGYAGGSTGGAYSAGAGETPAGQHGSGTGGYTGGPGQAGGAAGGNAYGGNAYGGGGGYPGGGGPAGGYGGGSPPQQIPNYLVQAILTTLCCCLPLGIVAIIYSTQVNTKRDAGDIAGAWEASKNAKKWVTIALIAGVVAAVLWGLLYGFAMIAAIAGSANGG